VRAPLNWTPCYGALEVSVLLLLFQRKYGRILSGVSLVLNDLQVGVSKRLLMLPDT